MRIDPHFRQSLNFLEPFVIKVLRKNTPLNTAISRLGSMGVHLPNLARIALMISSCYLNQEIEKDAKSDEVSMFHSLFETNNSKCLS